MRVKGRRGNGALGRPQTAAVGELQRLGDVFNDVAGGRPPG
jgi:hypothetical protein